MSGHELAHLDSLALHMQKPGVLIGNCWNCVALDWVRLAYLENDRLLPRKSMDIPE